MGFAANFKGFAAEVKLFVVKVGYVYSVIPVYDILSVSDRSIVALTPVVFEIIGGQHIYNLSDIFEKLSSTSTKIDKVEIVYVWTSGQCVDSYDHYGPTWRDGFRIAAYRQNAALCMCGDWKHITTFTFDLPNYESPIILSNSDKGGVCNCDKKNRDNDSPYYDFYFKCSASDHADGRDLLQFESCNNKKRQVSDNEFKYQNFEETRLYFIYSTSQRDRMSMKAKLWDAMVEVYGFEHAGLIMPKSYFLNGLNGREQLLQLVKNVIENNDSVAAEDQYFIVKNTDLHQQAGISIASANSIAETFGSFDLATVFIPRPFMLNGRKINIRVYVVAVCIGGHLRG